MWSLSTYVWSFMVWLLYVCWNKWALLLFIFPTLLVDHALVIRTRIFCATHSWVNLCLVFFFYVLFHCYSQFNSLFGLIEAKCLFIYFKLTENVNEIFKAKTTQSIIGKVVLVRSCSINIFILDQKFYLVIDKLIIDQ